MDAQHRAPPAMSVCAPLSIKIFGSVHVGAWLKFHFLHSLVLRRFLDYTQCWYKCSKSYQIINNVYMRALRRVAGLMRFGSDNNVSDHHVRSLLVVPSIDCLLMRRRLMFVARIGIHRFVALNSLLKQSSASKQLRWVSLVAQDLKFVYDTYASEICELYGLQTIEAPSFAPMQGLEFMSDAKWHTLVAKVFFIESCLDVHGTVTSPAHNFVCHECVASKVLGKTSFATAKALQSHQRVKHGTRNNICMYIGDTATCPSCKTVFSSRLSVVSHLSDSRRPKCRDAVLANCPILEPSVVAELNAQLTNMRRVARQCGRSHHIVTAPAVNAQGKQTGRITF